MLRLIIYSVEGRPSFELPADSTPGQIRQFVEDRFGWFAIGVPHTWFAAPV
jgi:hypothetical protein